MRSFRLVAASLTTGLLALTATATDAVGLVGEPDSTVAAASATATASTPRVGWWAGQIITVCNTDIGACPRDNTIYTDEVWDALQEGDGFLGFDLVYGSDFGPTISGVAQRTDAIPVLDEAKARGVELKAWLTVPFKMGTFANENNAQVIQDAVKAFDAWADARDYVFEEIVLDTEFPLGYQAWDDAITRGDVSGLKAMAKANFDPAHQCAAIRKYKETIAWAHNHDRRITGAPILFAIDDLKNGDLALADMFDMATALPEYDTLYVQAYRSVGADLSSGVVAQYYTEMQQRFGAKGQVSLGNTGSTPPYDTATGVANDIRMLAAMGATEIPIFDFNTTVATYGAEGVAEILAAAHNPMSSSELAVAKQVSLVGAGARGLFSGLDAYAAAMTPWFTLLDGHPQTPNPVNTTCN